MKCKIFFGEIGVAATLFQDYMKDKVLSKDVIIHSLPFPTHTAGFMDRICIVVIHPNWWDDPEYKRTWVREKRGNKERS